MVMMFVDCDLYLFGGCGYVDVVDFVFVLECVDDGVDDGWVGVDCVGFVCFFYVQWVGFVRDVVGFEYEGWFVCCMWQGVVYEGCCDELVVGGVIDYLFYQCLVDVLYGVVMDLVG